MEYLEVDAPSIEEHAWIDTEYVPNENSIISARFMCYDGFVNDYSAVACPLIAMRFGSSNGRVLVVSPQPNLNRVGAMGSSDYGYNIYNDRIDHDVEYSLKNKTVKFDDLVFDLKSSIMIFGTSPSLSLFKANGYGSTDYRGNGKIYYVKIKENNKVVLDMIPVVKDGVGYMYDKVSRRMFGAQGGGEFIVGPRKLY